MHKLIAMLSLVVGGSALASTDPITADPSTGAHFNRYAYANNNPYKYVDPDGRAARIVHHANGIRVEMPATFTGPGATPENIAAVTRGFESQSGVYNVNGAPTRVDFRITDVTKSTPRRLRNEVRMFDGPTDHALGVSYANALGGTKVSINVKSLAFPYGVGEHELNHLAGGDDAYKVVNGVKIPDPLRRGDIMNELPGRMTDTVVDEILQQPNNQHVQE